MTRSSVRNQQLEFLKLFQRVAEGRAELHELNHVGDTTTKPLPDMLKRRAALPRFIDKELYEEVVASGIRAPKFEEFQTHSEIEHVGIGSYALRTRERKDLLLYWRDHPGECVKYSGELERFYAKAGTEFDRFLHSLFATPKMALDRFLVRYRELDEAFALSGCEAMLRVLSERLWILPDDLRECLNEREQYLRSRTLFADDYYRTVVHLKRENAAKEFEEFLKDSNQWVFHVHGGGGVGKTVFLRWLIARRCIPEHDGVRIPVARIDIDAFDRRGLGDYPLLIFLPLMKQLTQQLAGNPFESHLHSLSDFETMLARPNIRESEGFRTDLKAQLQRHQLLADLPSLFANAIAGGDVLLVMDTLEDMMLHQRTQLLNILNLLGAVRRNCAGFRMVLSGRYDLTDQILSAEFLAPQNTTGKEAQAKHLRCVRNVLISNFTREESANYLRGLRKIEKPGVIEAITIKTKGHPLDLTLLADIFIADPSLTERQIRRLPPQYARLIERIIDRIPNEQSTLRWLLRYAVVPRRLDWEYVSHVINQPVKREGRGKSVRDNPRNYGDAAAQLRYGREERWKPLDRIELKKAWEQLLSYAAQTSWVTEEHGVVRLQPEVVEPMRELLRLNLIYRDLQLRSQRYFERVARARPAEWGIWTAEAIYHRFQRNEAGEGLYWTKKLRAARRKGFAEIEQIAGVVFGSEFLDEKRRPRVDVSRRDIARASYDLAYATVIRLLRLSSRHSDFKRLTEQLAERWKDLQFYTRGISQAVSRGHRTLIRAAYCAYPPDESQTVSQTRALNLALKASKQLAGDDQGRLVSELLIASRLYWLKLEKAKPHFALAYRIAKRTRSNDLPAFLTDRLLARNYLHVDDLQGAAKHFLRSWSALIEARESEDLPTVFRRTAETLFEAGAWRALANFQNSVKRRNAEFPALKSQWLLAQARLSSKLGDLEASMTATRQVAAAAKGANDQAVSAELQAEFESQLFEFDDAKRLFEWAESKYSESGSPAGVPTCRLKMARMYLDQAGDANRCRDVLASGGKVFPQPSLQLEAWRLEVCMLAAFNREEAKRQWSKSWMAIRREGFSPRMQARFLTVGFSLGLVEESKLKLLWPLLSKIRPVSAVYGVLEELSAFCGEPWARDGSERIAKYMPSPRPRSPEGVLHALAFAPALHFFGRGSQATILVKKSLAWCVARANEGPSRILGLESRIRRMLFQLNPMAYKLKRLPASQGPAQPRPAFRVECLEEAERAWHLKRTKEANSWFELCGFEQWPPALVRTKWGVRAELLSALMTGSQRKEARQHLIRARDLARDLSYPLPDWTEAALKEINAREFSEQEVGPVAATLSIQSGSSKDEALLQWSGPDGQVRGVQTASISPGWPLLSQTSFGHRISKATGRMPLRLRIEDRRLEEMIWEGMFPTTSLVYRIPPTLRFTETVRSMQTALVRRGAKLNVDGILGPETSLELRRLGGGDPQSLRAELLASGPAKGTVLIVQRDLEDERYLKRGHGFEAVVAADLYEKCRLKAVEHGYRSTAQLKMAMDTIRPSVIHVVTGFWQSKESDVMADMAPRFENLPARTLGSLLQNRAVGNPSPIVILEAVMPRSESEEALQACARNRYCADLFLAGSFKGVLGTGMWAYGQTTQALFTMLRSLARPVSLGDVYLGVRNLSKWPAALFTSDPLLPIWEQ